MQHRSLLRPAVLGLWLGLLALLSPPGEASGAGPDPERAIEEQARSGAWAAPGPAWHHLLLAEEAARAGDREAASCNYRLATQLDPDLLGAWIGLALQGFPDRPSMMAEGIAGAAGAVAHGWEAQRRLFAALLPLAGCAAVLAAILLLAAIGLRQLPRSLHVLTEILARRIGPSRGAGLAMLLALAPLGVRWGLLSAAAFYAALSFRDLARRDRVLAGVTVIGLLLLPLAWRPVSRLAAPIDPTGAAWLIDRAQREVPSPELEEQIASLSAPFSDPAAHFARGMLDRRNGRFREAAEEFRASADSATGRTIAALAQVNLGNLDFWLGDPTAAARAYEQVLDEEAARLEARFNLAIAMSQLHRFREADAHLEEAERIDPSQVRTATRGEGPRATANVMDGVLSADELWALEPEGGMLAPPVLSWMLPKGSPAAAVPALLVSLLLGGLIGSLLHRQLVIHSCHHCGGPVCRRCLFRVGGHPYCATCAQRTLRLAPAEHSRMLLSHLLDEDPRHVLRRRLASALPGVGPVLWGRTWRGALLLPPLSLGILLVTRAAWPFPPSPSLGALETVLRVLGGLLVAGAAGLSFLLVHHAPRRGSVARFFGSDFDRRKAA